MVTCNELHMDSKFALIWKDATFSVQMEEEGF